MTIKVELHSSLEDVNTLGNIADGRKSTVKVDREMLNRLVLDYSIMSRALSLSTTYRLIEPKPRRKRPQLNL